MSILSLPSEELRKLIHDLANKSAIAESALSMAELDGRMPESIREDVQDALGACQSVSGLVRQLQKLIG